MHNKLVGNITLCDFMSYVAYILKSEVFLWWYVLANFTI